MIQSILVIPIFADEKLWGHFGMEQSESEREWSNVEVDALVTAARMIGIAIERKEAESALLLAQKELIEKEKLATLGQLAGGVGHELRNPLGVINNALYILKATVAQENEKAREYADMIGQQVQRSNKIISDLLNFAREPGASRIEIDLSALVARVLADFPPPEEVRVRKTIAKGLPKVLADAQHAEQILANLVSNAYQAMPEGGLMSISASRKQGEVRIAVRDSGTGISKENMDKLFTPLYTTKAKGIGLGLATSKKLAETNGGRIEVKSQEGKGSTFTLVLPAAGGEDGA
jgi:signal transduction histidine kinase